MKCASRGISQSDAKPAVVVTATSRGAGAERKRAVASLSQPGVADIQLELIFDYQSNVAAYPRWQEYLRAHRPKTLIVWGRHDLLFTVAGAIALGRELLDAEIHLLNASHFALDEEAAGITALIQRFMAKRLSQDQ